MIQYWGIPKHSRIQKIQNSGPKLTTQSKNFLLGLAPKSLLRMLGRICWLTIARRASKVLSTYKDKSQSHNYHCLSHCCSLVVFVSLSSSSQYYCHTLIFPFCARISRPPVLSAPNQFSLSMTELFNSKQPSFNSLNTLLRETHRSYTPSMI